MSMVIGTNVASLTAQRHLASSRADMETSMERLSSGKRINSAMDDAAGLAIANKLESKVTGLNQAVRNANDGISLVQTAEGALEEVSDILNRMKELAVQASNGTYAATDLTAMNTEFVALATEITRISEDTDFNAILVTGATSTITFHIGDGASDTSTVVLQDMAADAIGGGATTTDHLAVKAITAAYVIDTTAEVSTQTLAAAATAGDTLRLTVGGTEYTQAFSGTAANTMALFSAKVAADDEIASVTSSATVLTITGASTSSGAVTANILTVTTDAATKLDASRVTTVALANASVTSVDNALATVDAYRSVLGAASNTLGHTVNNLMNVSENQSAAQSRIEDADYAVESANLAKAQVLQQAGTAMLAQANASGQSVLSLLK
ncbi:flagellin [Candidatus Njordibacter sp. Uisw_039]|uniref:flagellin N-terminal helical domain-containing protein n=1 Tax=Candidatus Njordibacter sp. Uisw_039 TaxID=3230972 RepID=UPI003D435FA9